MESTLLWEIQFSVKHISHLSASHCTCVVPPVQVVVTPANPDANIGDNVTIVCGINSSVPVAQYVWTLNGRILPQNVMVRSLQGCLVLFLP